MNHSEFTSVMWRVADLVRDTFKRGKYLDVILALKVVLRRPECVLARTKPKVLAVHAKYRGRIENHLRQLRRDVGFGFYNTSRYNFATLLADAPEIARYLRHYIVGFSSNRRDVLEGFDFPDTVLKLDEAGLPIELVQCFGVPRVSSPPPLVSKPTY